MTFLEFAKQYTNFDIFLVLIDDAGYTDEEIMDKFEVSKPRIYDARKRLEPILAALSTIEPYRRDARDTNVQLIVDAFSEAFGTTKTSRLDRFAAKRLHVKYGCRDVVQAIKALANSADDQYVPVVNSVVQFENKLPQIIRFLKNKSGGSMVEL